MKHQFHFYLKLFLLAISFGIGNSVQAQIIEVKSITCNGDSTGQVGAYPTFGTAPYTYAWSNGKTTQSIDGLKAGKYIVTMTDNLAVPKLDSIVLNQPIILATTIASIANSSWPVNNGKITISPSGGSGWYKYSLYDSTSMQTKNQPNPVFDNLASGNYLLTTSDLYGCKKIETIIISENAGIPITKAVLNIDTTACYRSTAPTAVVPDTAIMKFPVTITFDDGKVFTYIDTTYRPKGPFIVAPGDTVSGFSYNLAPGFHMITVYGNDGKGFRYSWTVDSILADVSLTWIQANINCFGAKTGSINAKAQGSWNNYKYSISGPGFASPNAASVAGLGAGVYTIVATDYMGCSVSQSVTIKQPDQPLHIVFNDPTPASCVAAQNGAVSINRVDGALAPITYTWSNTQTTSSINGLFTGTYSVAVSDKNGCVANDQILVPAGLGATGIVFDEPKHASCPQATNGFLNVNRVDGATYPVSYIWSNTQITQSISTLPSGTYTVTITDINNCSITDSKYVPADSGLVGIVFDDPIKPTCLTAKNGNGRINRVDGATKPLVYLWSNGITKDEIDSVYIGKYFVTVTDANNCFKVDSINVEVSKEPFQIFFDNPINTRCPYSNDGMINIHNIEGFTNPVKYVWSNAETTTEIDSLAMGSYIVTVTDINTCKQVDSIEVRTENKACVFNVVTPNGDGYNDYFDISDLLIGLSKKAEIFNENGKMIAKLDDNNLRWDGIDPSNPPNGPSSTFTVFIEVTKNGKLYKKWAETISVIYAK